MSNLDRIRQSLFPTVAVPIDEPLAPCGINCVRLLMAGNGLFIELTSPFGRIVGNLWQISRPKHFPYGTIKETFDDFFTIIEKAYPIIASQIIPEAASFAERDLEWSGFIVMKDGELYYERPRVLERSKFNISVQWPSFSDRSLAIDIHSHGKLDTAFSTDDNRDDKGATRICIVLGNYRVVHDRPVFNCNIRFAVHGFFWDIQDLKTRKVIRYEESTEYNLP